MADAKKTWGAMSLRKVIRDFLRPDLAHERITINAYKDGVAGLINEAAIADGHGPYMAGAIANASNSDMSRRQLAAWVGISPEQIWPQYYPCAIAAVAKPSGLAETAVADCINDGAIAGLSLPLPPANDAIVLEVSHEDILGATALLLALADLKDAPPICMPDEAKVRIELLDSPWADWKRATMRLLRNLWCDLRGVSR